MDRLVDHLFVFEGDGEIRDFPGNYTLYREWLKANERKGKDKWGDLGKMKSEGISTDAVTASKSNNVNGNLKPGTGNQRKPTYNEKKEFEQLEKDIKDLEAEKNKLEESLGTLPFEEIQKASIRIGQISLLLSEKEMRWLELSEIV
jgi:ATP-binding cassette subfamily F protein uup